MFDIWNSLNGLQQPCLRRPISHRMVGADGLIRRDILVSLDRVLCEHLACERASFQAATSPPPISMAQRFINVSALQKSIRRGDAEGAMRFAVQGCALDSEQVFRRLAVCAVEDVGIGNLLAVGMALAVMGSRSMRCNESPSELAAYLAYTLAISPKSRLACDLLSIADYDRSIDRLKREMAVAGESELAAYALARNHPMAERMVAAWLLAGTARYRGTTMPQVARGRSAFMRLLVARRVPLMLYYVADRTGARLSDAMFVSLLPIAELISADPEIEICTRAVPGTGVIDGYPAAAFDLHTAEGRSALSRFGREYAPIAAICKSLPPGLRVVAVRHGVFIAEGGRLARQLRFEKGNRIEEEAHSAELRFSGLANPSQRSALIAAINASIPELFEARRHEYKRMTSLSRP